MKRYLSKRSLKENQIKWIGALFCMSLYFISQNGLAQIEGPSRVIKNQNSTFRYTGDPPEDLNFYFWEINGGTIISEDFDSIVMNFSIEGNYSAMLYYADYIDFYEIGPLNFSVVTPTLEYTYDGVGNRVKREIVYYCQGQKKSAKTRKEITKELEESQVSMVYPNPTDNEIFLKVEDDVLASAQKSYVLYDASGKAVLNGKINSGLENIKVDNLPDGSYFLILSWGNQRKEWKIIKY